MCVYFFIRNNNRTLIWWLVIILQFISLCHFFIAETLQKKLHILHMYISIYNISWFVLCAYMEICSVCKNNKTLVLCLPSDSDRARAIQQIAHEDSFNFNYLYLFATIIKVHFILIPNTKRVWYTYNKVFNHSSNMSESNGNTINNQLVKVNHADWPALRDLYQSDWPEHFLGFSTVDTFIRWTEQQPDIKNLAIYSLNGNWADGTFVCVVNIYLKKVIKVITFIYRFLLFFSIVINYLLIHWVHRPIDFVRQ